MVTLAEDELIPDVDVGDEVRLANLLAAGIDPGLARQLPSGAFGGEDATSSAISVGRDHLGATVNTLGLAYAGAALPVLLIFSTQGTGLASAINRENVAEEIVATLVGSIGLIAAVPLTTALAALLAERRPMSALPEEHGHVH